MTIDQKAMNAHAFAERLRADLLGKVVPLQIEARITKITLRPGVPRLDDYDDPVLDAAGNPVLTDPGVEIAAVVCLSGVTDLVGQPTMDTSFHIHDTDVSSEDVRDILVQGASLDVMSIAFEKLVAERAQEQEPDPDAPASSPMTTQEIIAALQTADPSGKLPVRAWSDKAGDYVPVRATSIGPFPTALAIGVDLFR